MRSSVCEFDICHVKSISTLIVNGFSLGVDDYIAVGGYDEQTATYLVCFKDGAPKRLMENAFSGRRALEAYWCHALEVGLWSECFRLDWSRESSFSSRVKCMVMTSILPGPFVDEDAVDMGI